MEKIDFAQAKSWVANRLSDYQPNTSQETYGNDVTNFHKHTTPYGTYMIVCHPLFQPCEYCLKEDPQPPPRTSAPGIAGLLRAFYGLQDA